jgi:Ser/Thr protein kinase RdoA (MazF antagonist)
MKAGPVMLSNNEVISFAGFFTDDIKEIRNLDGFHNEVYQVSGNREFILRAAPSPHGNYEQTLSEICFLIYLKKNGVPLSEPLTGLDGGYVYRSENKYWTLSAYSIAEGLDFRSRGIDTETRFEQIGRTAGMIHRLSKLYKPSSRLRRRQWHENPHLVKAPAVFLKAEPRLARKYEAFVAKMNDLPINDDSFGLIHGDYLFSNYMLSGGKITVIDFDECEYSWFIYDIAVCMYYYLLGGDPSLLPAKKEEAQDLFCALAKGYLMENNFERESFLKLDMFFKMREFVLLSTVLDMPGKSLGGWQKSFIAGAVDRQLHDKPFIEADFVKALDSVMHDTRGVRPALKQ